MDLTLVTHSPEVVTRPVVTGSAPLTVMVAASSALVRWGLRGLVCDERAFDLIGEADGWTVLKRLLKEQVPDVLIVGSSLFDGSAGGVVPCETPHAVVFLENDVNPKHLLRAGVRGFIHPDDDAARARATIDAVHHGAVVLNTASIEQMLTGDPDAGVPPAISSLGRRELDVLACVAKGWTNREISDHLFLTEGTVKGYVSSILTKLQLPNRTVAALRASRWPLAQIAS